MPGEQTPGGKPPAGEPGLWRTFGGPAPRGADRDRPGPGHAPRHRRRLQQPAGTGTAASPRALPGQSFATVISTANGLVSAIDDANATQIMISCDALHNNYRAFLQPVPDPPVVHPGLGEGRDLRGAADVLGRGAAQAEPRDGAVIGRGGRDFAASGRGPGHLAGGSAEWGAPMPGDQAATSRGPVVGAAPRLAA